MPKNIELPPRVAQAFVRDMRAFLRAKNQLKQDEIASRQLHSLQAFQRPREKKLRLSRRADVIHLAPFEQGEIGPDLFRAACEMMLEGLVSKRRDSRYRAGPSRTGSRSRTQS